MPRAPLGWVSMAALLATAIKLFLAVNTIGTADTLYFYGAVARSAIGTPYSDGVRLLMVPQQFEFQEPGLSLHLAGVADWLSGLFHQEVWVCWRALSALADLGTLFLLWRLGLSLPLLVVTALSPVAILLSGFHGHSDAFVVLLVTLTVWLHQRYPARPLLAGIALGLAGSVQPWALLLLACVPTLLPALAGAAAAWLLTSLPYLATEPAAYLKALTSFTPAINGWGLAHLVTAKLWPLAAAAVVALGWWLRIRYPKQPLGSRFALCALAYLVLSPAAGIHHLGAIQLLAFAGWELLAFVSLAATAFLTSSYNAWTPNQSWPWQTALAIDRPWQGLPVLYELLAYGCVAASAYALWRKAHVLPPPVATMEKPKPSKRK